MHQSSVRPFNQKIRINSLRGIAAVLIPLVLFVRPILEDTGPGEVMEIAGVLLIVAGVMGRFWSILYIGGRKNDLVMDQGPYSLCRHPLYLFSTLAIFGFGLMLQSLVFAILLTAVVFTVLSMTAAREERFLRDHFGPAYAAYAARTPRIVPNPALFRTQPRIDVSVDALKTNFFDAIVFLALIPLAESIEEIRNVLTQFAWTLF